jgi:hypothetical protein
LTGNIFIQLDKPFPGKKLELKITGGEKVSWEPKRKNKDFDILDDLFLNCIHDSRDIIKHTFTIYKFATNIMEAGQYTFPFKVKLPSHLPSTCVYKDWWKQNSFGKVSYSLKAILVPVDRDKIQSMTFKSSVVIRQNPPEDPESSTAQFYDKVNTCCC